MIKYNLKKILIEEEPFLEWDDESTDAEIEAYNAKVGKKEKLEKEKLYRMRNLKYAQNPKLKPGTPGYIEDEKRRGGPPPRDNYPNWPVDAEKWTDD